MLKKLIYFLLRKTSTVDDAIRILDKTLKTLQAIEAENQKTAAKLADKIEREKAYTAARIAEEYARAERRIIAEGIRLDKVIHEAAAKQVVVDNEAARAARIREKIGDLIS